MKKNTMKAVVYDKYGTPDDLSLAEVAIPTPGPREVLIRVFATSLNGSDCEFLKGRPLYVRMWGLVRPKYKILGSDIAGEVVRVGEKVSKFHPGDQVFGDIMGYWGGLAQYACAPESCLLQKPQFLSYEDAAAIPQAALVALQGLREKGRIEPGQDVLINGAGGGSGSFAIQLAKMFGAKVTGVDSASKLEFMRTLGADVVIDYKKENFTQNDKTYDLILDFTASHSIFQYKKSLKPGGTYVMVGGTMKHIFQTVILGSLISWFSRYEMGLLAARPNRNLSELADFVIAEKIKPIITKKYPLKDASEAMGLLCSGKVKGKVVVLFEDENKMSG